MAARLRCRQPSHDTLAETMQRSTEGQIVELAFIGLHGVFIGSAAEIQLCDGLSLVKPNRFILTARSKWSMNLLQYKEAEDASRYLVYRLRNKSDIDGNRSVMEAVQNALLAMHIVKPVRTLGLIFYGFDDSSPVINLQRVEHRSPTDAGDWARMRVFDESLLVRVPPLIEKVNRVMAGQIAETKNALFLLQMGLEHTNPLISGLLFTMGLDAVLGGYGRKEFKERLCACLGAKMLVFPDWNPSPHRPLYTVEDVASDLYTLRNKLAHGVDLRAAAQDKSTPVDLLKPVNLTELSQRTTYSMILSQAACFLLCQVLEKTL